MVDGWTRCNRKLNSRGMRQFVVDNEGRGRTVQCSVYTVLYACEGVVMKEPKTSDKMKSEIACTTTRVAMARKEGGKKAGEECNNEILYLEQLTWRITKQPKKQKKFIVCNEQP